MTLLPNWRGAAFLRRIAAFACAVLALGAAILAIGRFEWLGSRVAITAPQPEQGGAFVADIRAAGLRVGTVRASRFRLLEDGKPIGRAESIHDDIRRSGGGAYSIWGETLYFSTPDGSDPRTNGRRYEIAGPAPVPIWSWLGLAVLAILFLPDRAVVLMQVRSRLACWIAEPAAQALLIATSLCQWQPWRGLVETPAAALSVDRTIGLLAILVLALTIRRTDVPRSSRLILYGLAILFASWAASLQLRNWPSLGVTPASSLDAALLSFGAPIAAVGLLLAAWRPALAVLPIMTACFVWQARGRLVDINITSMVDFEPVAEVGIFLVLAVVAARLAHRLMPTGFVDEARLANHLTLIAIAIHLSNYLYSGLQKINLDGGGINWMLSNPTWMLAYHARDLGAFPFHGAEALHTFGAGLFKALVVPGNIVTLVGQVASVVAVVSLPLTAAFMIFYDVWHLTVLVTTGIFFWKWMVLNGCCAWAVTRIESPQRWFRWLLLPLVVAVAPNFFAIARLGWYDSGALNLVSFWAADGAGQRTRVPSNFFGSHSFNAFSNWGLLQAGYPIQARAFESHIYGTVYSLAEREMARRCELKHQGETLRGLPGLEKLVRLSHRIGLASPGTYDWHPHHVWSNPFSFRDFKALDLTTVKSYVVVLEARCVEEDGTPHARTVFRQELEIPVASSR